jgi:hypothetical protein
MKFDFIGFTTFVEAVSATVGTRKWFVGRWSPKTRAKFEARITSKEYAAMQAAWEQAQAAKQAAALAAIANVRTEPKSPARTTSARRRAPRILITVTRTESTKLGPRTHKIFRVVPANNVSEQLDFLNRAIPDAVITCEPERYRRRKPHIPAWRPPHNWAEQQAIEYARWLAARDGIVLPTGKEVKIWIDWQTVESKTKKTSRRRWDGSVIEQPALERRAASVAWGHDEPRKMPGRYGWRYNEFVCDVRIDIPHWDFDPDPPVEETIAEESVVIGFAA